MIHRAFIVSLRGNILHKSGQRILCRLQTRLLGALCLVERNIECKTARVRFAHDRVAICVAEIGIGNDMLHTVCVTIGQRIVPHMADEHGVLDEHTGVQSCKLGIGVVGRRSGFRHFTPYIR